MHMNKNIKWAEGSARRKLTSLALCVPLLSWASLPALAQNEVFFTMDPKTTNPTVVAEPSAANVVVFRSLDYVNTPPTPEPFMLIFELSFKNQYDTGGSWTPGTVTGSGVTFQSEAGSYQIPQSGGGGAVVPAQEVRIKFKSGAGAVHPDEGYKYDLLMGGGVLDPRVVPR